MSPTALARSVVLVALILCFSAPVAGAADPLGPINQISNAGPAGDLNFTAAWPAVAASTRSDAELIVWIEDKWDNPTSGAVTGRLFNPVTNSPIGAPFVIGGAGTLATGDYNPPNVAYNSVSDEYLVTWNTNDTDIWIKRVSAAGVPIGVDTKISDVAYSDIETTNPAYSPETDRYIVVWKSVDGGPATQQVRGQMLTGSGTEIGSDFQISHMSSYADDAVAVAYAPALQRFMVTWRGRSAPVASEFEAYVQQITTDGTEFGGDVRVSDVGPDGNSSFQVQPPSVAWNSVNNEWLVAWGADDDQGGQVDNELEALAQRLNPDGGEIGANDFRVTHFGVDGDESTDTFRPRVSYNPFLNEYLFAFHAGSSSPDLYEVYTQRVNAATGANSGDMTQVTNYQPDTADMGGTRPALAYSPRSCNWTIAYNLGDIYPDTDEASIAESEVFAQTIMPNCPPPPPACPAGTSPSVSCSPDSDGKGVRMVGTNAGETFVGTGEGDTILAGGGRDKVRSGSGNDRVNAGAGNDTVSAGNGNDNVKGGKGNDTLRGGKGNDKLYGEAGKDKLFGEAGKDSLSGGASADRLSGGKGKDKVTCGAGKDKVSGKRGDRLRSNCRP